MHVEQAAGDILERSHQSAGFAPQPKLHRSRPETTRSAGQYVERGLKIATLSLRSIDERRQHATFLAKPVLDLVPRRFEMEIASVVLGDLPGEDIPLLQVEPEIVQERIHPAQGELPSR